MEDVLTENEINSLDDFEEYFSLDNLVQYDMSEDIDFFL